MTEPTTSQLTLDRALQFLKQYSCRQEQGVASETEQEPLRQALLLVTSLSEWENLGICADNPEQAIAVLKSYLLALGYSTNFNSPEIVNSDKVSEGVYLKFNTQRMSSYLDRYSGGYRGVLVSCQAEDEKIIGTYGHFPLDLFAETN